MKGDVVVEWECLKFDLSSKAFSQGGYRNAVSEFSLAVNTQEVPDASGTSFTIQIYSTESLYCCIVTKSWTQCPRSPHPLIVALIRGLLIRYAGNARIMSCVTFKRGSGTRRYHESFALLMPRWLTRRRHEQRPEKHGDGLSVSLAYFDAVLSPFQIGSSGDFLESLQAN